MLLSMGRPQSSSFVYSESRILLPISIQNRCHGLLPRRVPFNRNGRTRLGLAWIGGSGKRIRVLATVTMSAASDLSTSFVTFNAEYYDAGGFSTHNTADYVRTWPISMTGTSPRTNTSYNASITVSQYKPLVAEKGLELLVETVQCRFPHENTEANGLSMNIEKAETEFSKDNDTGTAPNKAHTDHVKEIRQEFNRSMIGDGSISPEEKEKLRRQRISEANRGRIPWNKGKQHSEETKRRIRETVTKTMRDPKMREKLRLQAMAVKSCPEIMLKIKTGIKNAWKRKREIRAMQETCVVEWKEMIAESARIGNDGDEIYQWDSYTIIKQQLRSAFHAKQKQERKNVTRRRTALSEEHKLRISQKIKEKWADPAYREIVQKGVEDAVKRHTARFGSGTKEHTEFPGVNWQSQRMSDGTRSKKLPVPKPAVDVPAYKDSEITMKLEKLKSMRAYRLAVEEMKRRDITERARVLIAQAEEAAKALEAAAKKDRSALAPLLETRRLLAEAVQSIASASRGDDTKPLQSGDENQAV